MTRANSPQPLNQHPRTLAMESWRARKAALASRGETSGPRVDECDRALTWWANRKALSDMGFTVDQVESLLDVLDKAEAETAAEVPAEADAEQAEVVS